MKLNTILLLVAAVLFLVAVLVLPKSCVPSAKYAQLKADHDALLNEFDKLKKQSAAIVEQYNKQIAEKDSIINATNAEIAKKNAVLAGKDKTIAGLEGQYATLQDCPSRLVNMTAQRDAWKDKFSVAEGIIKDKDSVIFSLNEKYNIQVKLTEQYKGLYDNCQKLYDLQVAMNKELSKVVSANKLLGGVKTGAIIAIAGVLGYELLKGKPKT